MTDAAELARLRELIDAAHISLKITATQRDSARALLREAIQHWDCRCGDRLKIKRSIAKELGE